jgi:Flp pilus assembly protein TadB
VGGVSGSGIHLVLALLGGGSAGGGLLLLVRALVGGPPVRRPVPSLADRVRAGDLGRRLAVATVLAAAAMLVSGWLVVAVGVGLLGFFASTLLGGVRQGRAQVARLEAVAAWTESLRDTIAGAVGLEHAIPATYHAAAPVLKPHLALLVDRLGTREPMSGALLRLAADLDDPSTDLVLSALVLNARLRGPGLREVLTALSKAAREEVDMRRRVEASRASTRRSVQIITGLTITVVLGLRLLNPQYVQPYDSPGGQAALGVVCGLFAAGFLWLRSLSRHDTAQRFLVGDGTVAPVPGGTAVP